MNHNVAKMVCVVVLGGVIKSLYGRPAIHNHYPSTKADTAETPKEIS